MQMNRRPRRNRLSRTVRGLTQETFVQLEQLIYPILLIDGEKKREAISAMPGIYRYSIDEALKEIAECISLGINTFVLFPGVDESLKDSTATYSYSDDNFYLKAIKAFKERFSEICIVTDVALDPYSSDGHDGLVEGDKILNNETLPILAKMALAQTAAGADIIGPSDMMDGRVGYLRQALDQQGYTDTAIMSYSVKYASSFYGPFRNALDSAPKKGDKKTYQMSFTNKREALVEAELDYVEGADYLMVKPAILYLDIIHCLKQAFDIPIVAYNVSGEYSMIKAAATAGYLNENQAITEMLYSIRRAGADIIITYFAKQFAQLKL